MTIDNPDVTDTSLEAVVTLKNRLFGLSRQRVICHCCSFRRAEQGTVTRLTRTLDDGTSVELGRWDFAISPQTNEVIMRRTAAGHRLEAVEFGTGDTNTQLRDKIIDAVEDIRQAGGVVASQADIDALKAVVDTELAD